MKIRKKIKPKKTRALVFICTKDCRHICKEKKERGRHVRHVTKTGGEGGVHHLVKGEIFTLIRILVLSGKYLK